jgi:hypothetical protein
LSQLQVARFKGIANGADVIQTTPTSPNARADVSCPLRIPTSRKAEAMASEKTGNRVRRFLTDNRRLDYEVLRPLSHILANWELSWDSASGSLAGEEDSYATLLNELIAELESCRPPAIYHDSEDRLGEYVQQRLNWPVRQVGKRWVWEGRGRLEIDDYIVLLEQGGFDDKG